MADAVKNSQQPQYYYLCLAVRDHYIALSDALVVGLGWTISINMEARNEYDWCNSW